ncbi:hypothetical protein [Caballeronia concitans]|uniref:p-aminobenzoate N-oxygenase AurF n=1 Tax=Caballeronia concitans TaxID=1777133 RepID=A0A658QV00_9BURK|nr:hypothetical protein [Caballeronia concitans]KIG07619.1 hypothetical protein BurMR1_0449 [Burkholderia sp. MR1]SAL23605.1 hypothetical protein AWB72_01743 [Caballeronia concitans]
MNAVPQPTAQQRYARCIEVSRRIRWDIDRDVLRGRRFDPSHKFMPDGLTEIERLPFLESAERLLMSQIQGRTYANMFGLIERFIGAKMMDVGRDHALSDQTAFEAIVRFTDEELKHQELFRRVEALAADVMPYGYRFIANADDVAAFVLTKSTWAILALTCCVEIVTQVHYRESMETDGSMSPLFKDIFLFHWKEESQHAIIDELEWMREDSRIDGKERDDAIGDLIDLVGAIDGMLQAQAVADAQCFLALLDRALSEDEEARVHAGVLDAYRWQYIVSGIDEPRFEKLLTGMVSEAQGERLGAALAGLRRRTLHCGTDVFAAFDPAE